MLHQQQLKGKCTLPDRKTVSVFIFLCLYPFHIEKGLPTLSFATTSKDLSIGFVGTLLVRFCRWMCCAVMCGAFQELSLDNVFYIVGSRFIV